MRRRTFVGAVAALVAAMVATAPNSGFAAADLNRLHMATAAGQTLYPLSPNRDSVWMYDGSSWTRIGGPAANIYAGGGAVVATNPHSGDVWGYNHTTKQWERVGGPGRHFAIDDGRHLWGLNDTGVYGWTGGTNWIQVGGPAAVVRAGAANGLIATDPRTGDVNLYLGTPHKWTRIGGPGRDFAVGSTGKIWGHSDAGVYEWRGSGTDWTRVGGPAANIYAGSFLVATNPQTGDLHRYLGTPGNWSHVGGSGITFAVTGDGTLYGLNSVGVFRWVGGTSWTQVGGPAATIAA